MASADELPWKPWTPAVVASWLSKIRTESGEPVRWAVAAGWAIDLFLDRSTREHDDIEIVVLNDDVPAVLSTFGTHGWSWQIPIAGELFPLDFAALAESHQTWLYSHATQAFVLDVFRDCHEGDTWICRRDKAIRAAWHTVTASSADGLPYLAPEIVLLFKAKHARAKDSDDLMNTLPALNQQQLDWLRTSLDRVHPGHPWLTLI